MSCFYVEGTDSLLPSDHVRTRDSMGHSTHSHCRSLTYRASRVAPSFWIWGQTPVVNITLAYGKFTMSSSGLIKRSDVLYLRQERSFLTSCYIGQFRTVKDLIWVMMSIPPDIKMLSVL